MRKRLVPGSPQRETGYEAMWLPAWSTSYCYLCQSYTHRRRKMFWLGGGGATFFNNKNVISLRNNAYTCNTVYNTALILCKQWVKLGGDAPPTWNMGGRLPPPPLPPASYAYDTLVDWNSVRDRKWVEPGLELSCNRSYRCTQMGKHDTVHSHVIRCISPISAYPLLGGGFCSWTIHNYSLLSTYSVLSTHFLPVETLA